jgi:hypothetical protein
MRRIRILILVSSTFTLGLPAYFQVGAVATTSIEQSSRNGIELSVGPGGGKPEADRPALGLSSRLAVTLTNRSQELFVFMTTIPENDFALDLIDASGKSVPLTELGKKLPATEKERQGWLLAQQFQRLAPGESYTVEIDLALYFQVRTGQMYTAKVRRGIGTRDATGKTVRSELSNSRKLTITTAVE